MSVRLLLSVLLCSRCVLEVWLRVWNIWKLLGWCMLVMLFVFGCCCERWWMKSVRMDNGCVWFCL